MILLFKIPEPIHNIITWIINLWLEYGHVVYPLVTISLLLWLFVWWNLLSEREQRQLVFWPQIVFILIWPITLIFFIVLGTPTFVFTIIGMFIVNQIKKRRK